MCSRRALWCSSASPRCCRTARCSPSASTGHISSGGGGQAQGRRISHLCGGHFLHCARARSPRGTYSAFLHQVGDHDDDSSVLLPHHPPEVLKRGLERTLGCDVSSGLVVALKGEEGEDGPRSSQSPVSLLMQAGFFFLYSKTAGSRRKDLVFLIFANVSKNQKKRPRLRLRLRRSYGRGQPK